MTMRPWSVLAGASLLVLVLGGCIEARRDDFWREDRWWEWRQRELERRFRPPPVLHAADLRPRSDDPFVQGETVSIRVKVDNEGDAAAEPFDVVAEVTVRGGIRHPSPSASPTSIPGNPIRRSSGPCRSPAFRGPSMSR